MKSIKKFRPHSESELVNYFNTNYQFKEIYNKRKFSLNFKKTLKLEMQSCLDTVILILTKEYFDYLNSCFSPKQSTALMKE